MLELGNLAYVSFGMADATGDHMSQGRSFRSSRRTGKPSTGRREAVDTVSRQEGDKVSVSVNTGVILDMQRKLYSWSRKDTQKVYTDLFNLVSDKRTIQYAWRLLSRNVGSRTPGIDGMTRRKTEGRPGGVAQFLLEVHEELRTGKYTPQPVRQRLIPKLGSPGKYRPLGIPTLKDRLVQMALKIVLEPIFEADFYATSYGFRRGRSTMDALAMIQRQLQPTRVGESKVEYVIEGDIKGCFDNIDHHQLMERIRKRVKDRKVLRLILAFLKAGIMAEGRVRHPVTGTPQGGIISPLLANIYLSAIEERYSRWIPRPAEPVGKAQVRRREDRMKGRPTYYLVRYADDFVVLVTGTRQEAEAEKDALAEYIRMELHMELSMEKTLITRAEEGFEFLGYRVVKERAVRTGRLVGKLRIPKGKLQLLRDRLKARTGRKMVRREFCGLLKELNRQIAGWRSYYRYAAGASKEFAHLDWWLWQRIRLWLKKKHKDAGFRQLRRRYAQKVTPSRWTWAENRTRLRSFHQGGTGRYICRGTRISNGWNDQIDGVRFYPEVARSISGYDLLMDVN